MSAQKPKELIRSESEIPPRDLRVIQHTQKVERWKHIGAFALLACGFIVLGITILSPCDQFDEYREKAWTLLTVLLTSVVAYLYSFRDEK